MAEAVTGTEDVAKRRKGVLIALLLVLVVLVAIVGVLYLMDLPPFGSLGAAGDDPPAVTAPPKSVETTESAEATSTKIVMPPAEMQAQMYREQVASQEQIGELVEGEYLSMEVLGVEATSEVANVRIKANYEGETSINGTLVLRAYEGAWFFSMITRDGHPESTPASVVDAAVAKTIAEQQAQNQEIVAGIVDGTYSTITVDRVTTGSGTAMMDITLSGPGANSTKGQITCIRKAEDGTAYWFITSFSKS